jgi:alanine racemase
MSLKTRIAFLKQLPEGETVGYGRTFTANRPLRVATLPIGYQDGYNRLLSNKGRVMIGGRYAPVIGRISMDWTIVDVTDILDPAEGDEVVLIGRSGDVTITAEDIARMIGTISYEVTCAIDRRVERVYTPARSAAGS